MCNKVEIDDLLRPVVERMSQRGIGCVDLLEEYVGSLGLRSPKQLADPEALAWLGKSF